MHRNHLIAVRCDAHDPDIAIQQQIKPVGGLTFLENRYTGLITAELACARISPICVASSLAKGGKPAKRLSSRRNRLLGFFAVFMAADSHKIV
jgi:hypothetical protein